MLVEEWRSLERDSLRERFPVWRRAEPALVRYGSAGGLLDALAAPRTRADADAALRALLVSAREDALARRVVLQALLPGLAELVERLPCRPAERADLARLLLSCAWQRIAAPRLRVRSPLVAELARESARAAIAELRRERAGGLPAAHGGGEERRRG